MTTATTTKDRTEKRKAFLHGVFVTAMEGGIGYWAIRDEYSWSKAGAGAVTGVKEPEDDIDGFYAILESNEDDWGTEAAYIAETGGLQPITETQSLRVDIDTVERGVNLLVDKVIEATKSEAHADFSNTYLRQFVVAWLTDGEDGDYDADGADLAVQLGLFGEVVYG